MDETKIRKKMIAIISMGTNLRERSSCKISRHCFFAQEILCNELPGLYLCYPLIWTMAWFIVSSRLKIPLPFLVSSPGSEQLRQPAS